MGKKSIEPEGDDDMEEEEIVVLSPIAQPLAPSKLVKKILKLVKTSSKTKSVRRGVKEVVKAVRKGEKGVCVIAGDISPIDVISHLPVLCEDNSVPYIFVPSKEALGTAGQTKRPTSCVLIKEKYDEVFKKVKSVQMY
ncbi:50S ribosomal protein L30e-like protein [Baffinella frigidus]|nr:50S ribosomal protein L30e-like protein [Cryptophyta sp. CCMP2293]